MGEEGLAHARGEGELGLGLMRRKGQRERRGRRLLQLDQI
jgi:hypothetical protein